MKVPLAGISDPKRYLAESLGAASRAEPGLLPPLLGALGDQHRAALLAYLAAAGVQLC